MSITHTLSAWINHTDFKVKAKTWLDLFNQSVADFPEKPAVFFNDSFVSYKELDEMSNWFARQIIENSPQRDLYSPQRDLFIGIGVSRSPAMLAAMIGTHKAGKAYLPLDSGFPPLRLKHMISDSGTHLIISDNPDLFTHSVESLENIGFIDANQCVPIMELDTSSILSGEDCAYILYTSGSSGTPKGVVVEHGAFLNFLLSMQREPGCSPGDRMLALTTISFDISGLELFLPLISGASLRMVTKEAIFNPVNLVKMISQWKISIIQGTPSVFKLLLDTKFIGLKDLKLLCGGDIFSKDLANKLFETGCEVWNMYGPTETTIWSSVYKIDKYRKTAPPIGMPIANTGLHILDENRQPVKPGESGQLWISGLGLARGYWNRKELSDSVFCLLGAEEKQRMYNTGDFVFEAEDGQIGFIGRQDNQIKINGFRIEAGDIEQRLLEIDGIKDAVVLSREDSAGNRILAAYFVQSDDSVAYSVSELRNRLKLNLPDYMIPGYYLKMDSFPLTPNKKIDRKSFPGIPAFETVEQITEEPPTLIGYMRELWSQYLKHSEFNDESNFFDIGGHSLLLVRIVQDLSRYLGREVNPLVFFENPSIKLLSAVLDKDSGSRVKRDVENVKEETSDREGDDFSLAVIGMSCAVPGAEDIEQFWDLLVEGRSGIADFSVEELLSEGLSPEIVNQPNYVRRSGSLPSSKYFDAAFFGYSPMEARFMDPQHRLMLEHCYAALESAGIVPRDFPGKIAVFAGAGQNKYLIRNILFSSEKEQWSDHQIMLGNENDYLASRVSYKMDLRGPALTIQTACSSSLVAIQAAYQSLLSYQCDAALCGGVSLNAPVKEGYIYTEGSILSPQGECRAFDANASGTIPGSGVGVVLLKRLNDAIKDNDPIMAIIRSASINNDGGNKIGFTAPSITGQEDVVKEALNLANISSSQISYIETHGTGTKLGDAIEITGLTNAFNDGSFRQQPCYIGSVKTNIGHLDAAAGVIGFIKTVLSLKNKKIPPSLNYNNPNPEMHLEEKPFVVNTRLRDWLPLNSLRIAGVSSFGIGGTNAHVILESYETEDLKPETGNDWLIFPVSAKTEDQLKEYWIKVNAFLSSANSSQKINIAHTLAVGRSELNYRSILIAPVNDGMICSAEEGIKTAALRPAYKNPKTVFLFSGQGSQYPGMGRALYAHNSIFKNYLDSCFSIIDHQTGWNSKGILFENPEDVNPLLNSTEYTQPLLFAFEWALGRTLLDLGIPCETFVGHSLGEYSAACLAGAFSLDDGIRLVVRRGSIMAKAGEGKMLAVFRSMDEIEKYLPADIDIAGVNAPNQVVFSGITQDIENLESRLSGQEIICKQLSTKSAFHSCLMDPVLDEFSSFLDSIEFKPLVKTVISNVTGELLNPGHIYKKEYWVEHLRRTIFFEKGILSLKDKSQLVFIEVGPGAVLSKLVRSIHTRTDKVILQTQPSTLSGEDDYLFFMKALGSIWKSGVSLPFNRINDIKNGRRIPIPTYPFARHEHWIYPDKKIGSLSGKNKDKGTSREEAGEPLESKSVAYQ